ncbi:MAG: putative glycoside hydrolase [Eubacteriales bacterium]|nr:putative glycoside hydrolase [Eubacteriales bacterium]
MKNKKKVIIITAAIVLMAAAVVMMLSWDFNGKNGETTKTTTTEKPTTIQNPTGTTTAEPTTTSEPTTTPEPTTTAEPTTTNQFYTGPTTTADRLDDFDDSKVKALYLTASSASGAKLNDMINLVNTTELNALVIDVKDWYVYYDSDIPMINEFKLDNPFYNPAAIAKKLHDNGIYAIARLVVFKDNNLTKVRPDLAIKTKDGKIWLENGNTGWTNPYIEEVWDYNIAIAKEVIAAGFDEVQFDYVRFPSGTLGVVEYGAEMPAKSDAICGFLEKAAKEIHAMGAKVSADIFGIVLESDLDGRNIGQELLKVGMNVDYVSPMIYPSHYANDSNGAMGNGVGTKISGITYTKPDLEPYSLVKATLLNTKVKLAAVDGYRADVRPFLQAFTADYLREGYYQVYGPTQIREQIQAVYDAGYTSWILWSAANIYPAGAFLTK